MRCVAAGNVPFLYISKYIETKTIFCGREFLHLGSAEFVFYSTILHIFIWSHGVMVSQEPAKLSYAHA